MKFRHFLTIWALVIGHLLCGCGEPGPRALLKGERLIKERRFTEAIAPLQRATQLLPKNAQAWNHLGLAYQASGQAVQAQSAYRRALALDFNLASVRFNLGSLALEQNDVSAAVEHLTSYTLSQPRSADGWVKLGNAQLRARRFDLAEKHYKAAVELQPNHPEALNGLGNIAFHRRKSQEALAYFNSALAEDPRYAPAVLNLAVIHHSQNQRQQALQEYQKYTALAPGSANVEAVNALIDQLELDLAPPRSSAIVSLPKTNVVAAPAPTKPAVTNLPPPIVVTPVRTSPPPPVITLRTATAPAVASSRPKTNLQPARNARATSSPPVAAAAPVRPPVATNKPVEVQVTELESDFVVKPAQDVVVRADAPRVSETPANIATNPPQRDAEKRSLLARLNPFNTRPKATNAPPVVKSAPALTTNEPSPVASAPPAVPEFPRYRYISPARPKAGNRREAERYFAQGVKAQQAGQLPQGLAAYQKASQADPSYFDAHYNRGLAAYEIGRWSQSLASYEVALALKPESIDTRYNFALSLKQAGYLLDAAEELKKILKASPDDARAHLSLANIYAQQLHQPRLARPHYLKVIETNPNHPKASEIRFWLAANP
ncbi:MAG: tetratricopeptide repeat protein [Verrucomicrobia subdivision 3 bacterium]|nr:tetratricopeptide repeat protein [Limisphaerales bacterium]